jgi:hypothetical protein
MTINAGEQAHNDPLPRPRSIRYANTPASFSANLSANAPVL